LIRLHHWDGDVYDDTLWWKKLSNFGSAVLSRIIPHHRRWKNIELNVPLTGLLDLAGTIPTGGLLHLTHLLLGSAY
jgi:hypothetical protein